MPIDPTPNLGLKKIDYGSAAWDADEHANADKIDAGVGRAPNKAAQFLSARFGQALVVQSNLTLRGPNLASGGDYWWDGGPFLGTTTYHSTYLGEDFAAGRWIGLPAGIWALEAGGYWDNNQVGDRIVEPIHIDSRELLAGDTISPMFGSPNQWQMLSVNVYQKAAALPANGQSGVLGFFFITPEMIAANHVDSPAGSPWAVSMQFYQDSGGARTISGYSLAVARLA